jgi:hypothetical protein
METTKFETKETTEYQSVIQRCYDKDFILTDRYHVIAPDTTDRCVQHTVDVFKKSPNFKMYILLWEGRFAGYIGVEKTDITTLKGFFLMPSHRRKTKEFFNVIREVCGNNVYTAVYEKNTRANKYLLRNNCKFVVEFFDETERQKVNLYIICHSEDY